MLGFCIFGVCIVGTLKAGLGFARFGAGPLLPWDEFESADEAKDAFVEFPRGLLGNAWTFTVATDSSSWVLMADLRRR